MMIVHGFSRRSKSFLLIRDPLFLLIAVRLSSLKTINDLT